MSEYGLRILWLPAAFLSLYCPGDYSKDLRSIPMPLSTSSPLPASMRIFVSFVLFPLSWSSCFGWMYCSEPHYFCQGATGDRHHERNGGLAPVSQLVQHIKHFATGACPPFRSWCLILLGNLVRLALKMPFHPGKTKKKGEKAAKIGRVGIIANEGPIITVKRTSVLS